MAKKTSFSYKLTPAQQNTLEGILRTGNYKPRQVPYSRIAAEMPGCNIVLFTSGKCLVQGKEAEDFVTFVLEPVVLQSVTLGYEDTPDDPNASAAHMGVDESGKGDFFGPLVTVAAYTDPDLAAAMREMGVRDSKNIKSDRVALDMGRALRQRLGHRFSIVKIGPRAYNRLYTKMRSVNTMLAWAHARAIENLLEAVPGCPRAISDQFGNKSQVERALMKKGQKIELIQQPRAESDIAVAAASVIAREQFLRGLAKIGDDLKVELPKGASATVNAAAVQLVKKHGPEVLLDTTKCHFKTADAVLAAAGADRGALGEDGQATSKPTGARPYRRKKSA